MVDETEHRTALMYISRLEKEIIQLKSEVRKSTSRSVTPSAPRSNTPLPKPVMDKEIQILKDKIAFLENTNSSLLKDMNRRTDNYVKEVMRLTGRKPASLTDTCFNASAIPNPNLNTCASQTEVPPLQDATCEPEYSYISSYIQTDEEVSVELAIAETQTQEYIIETLECGCQTDTLVEVTYADFANQTEIIEKVALVDAESQLFLEKVEYSVAEQQTQNVELCDQTTHAEIEPTPLVEMWTATDLAACYTETATDTAEIVRFNNSSVQTDTPDHSVDDLLSKIQTLSTMNDSLRASNSNYASELSEVERRAREELVSVQHRLAIVEESERKLKIRLLHSRGIAPETSRNY